MSTGGADGLQMDVEGIRAYLAEVWPETADGMADAITELRPGFCRSTTRTGPADLRPGGTVSGPVLMTTVDQAAYVLVLAHLGRAALAVTSHLSVEFLRRATPGVLVTDVELLKLGRTQVVMAVRVHAGRAGTPPVAAATVVYSRALLTPADGGGTTA